MLDERQEDVAACDATSQTCIVKIWKPRLDSHAQPELSLSFALVAALEETKKKEGNQLSARVSTSSLTVSTRREEGQTERVER